MKKGICIGSLPREGWSIKERFALAARAGYQGVEVGLLESEVERAQYRAAAEATGLEIPSVMAGKHWSHPLSSRDPSVRREGLDAIRASIDTAAALGADVVLVVPAVVTDSQPYQEAYDLSVAAMQELAPYAAASGITLAVENVWNRFLLTSREFNQYLDDVAEPNVQAYFDCGNILNYGHAQQWIRELGPRIARVHVKDFDLGTRTWRWLLQGSVPWGEVRQALMEIGYDSYLTAELPLYSAYPDQMAFDTSGALSRIIAGQ